MASAVRLSSRTWRGPGRPLAVFAAARAHGGVVANVALLSGGTAAGQVMAVVAAPLLTRLYTPDDMGKLGLYTAFISLASVATTLRFELAVVAARSVREAAQLTAIAFACLLPSSALLSLGFYVLSREGLLGFGALPAATCVWVLLSLIATGAISAIRYWFVRHEAFGLLSGVLIRQGFARSIAQLALGVVGVGWSGLLLGDLAGRAFGLSRMVCAGWRPITREVFPVDRAALVRVFCANYKFPVFNLPSSIIDGLAVSLMVPLIAQTYGIQSAGHFALVYSVQALPVALVGGSVADVFHARMARHARVEPQEIEPLFFSTARTLLLAGVLPTGILVVFGPRLFALVFGEAWTAAGQLAAEMAPWALASLVVSPLSRVIVVFQAQGLKFVYDVLVLLGVTASLLAGGALRLALLDSVKLLSVAQVVGYSVYFVLLLHVVRAARCR